MFCALLLVFYFVISIAAKCPPGSIQSYSDNTLCLNFQSVKTYYLDAEQVCKDLGGHLTSVHKPVDNMFLSQQALVRFNKSTDDDFWFGANDFISPPNWSWMDGTPFNYKYWDKGQPQNVSGNDCGAVLMQGGKWRAVDCFMQKPYVCTVASLDALTTTTVVTTPKRTTSKPKSCPDSWTFYETTGFCYKVFDSATWLDAEERCKVDGAHLASIHTEEENLFLANLAYWPGANTCDGLKQALIGLYREDMSSQWQWSDGTSYNYQNWAIGNPVNDSALYNYGYVAVAPICNEPTGRFRNWKIDLTFAKYICKK